MNIPPDWQPLQNQLDDQYNTSQDLPQVLQTLYDQQIESGFLSSKLLRQVNSLTPCQYGNGLYFQLQFNPKRLTRGVPKVPNPKPKHIIPFKGGIPCFCCLDNICKQWPLERGFFMNLNHEPFVFLPNIAPNFPSHFTVAALAHRVQQMDIDGLLTIAEKLPGYWVVLNGPDAGATNPWHFHYQCFKAHLPIEEVPVSPIQPGISRCQFPASAYRFDFNGPIQDLIKPVQNLTHHYLSSGPHHRLNFLVKHEPNQKTTLFMILRQTQHTATLYKSGQPGYAEIAGLIALVTQSSYDHWQRNGEKLYTQLLTEICVPETISNQFESSF